MLLVTNTHPTVGSKVGLIVKDSAGDFYNALDVQPKSHFFLYKSFFINYSKTYLHNWNEISYIVYVMEVGRELFRFSTKPEIQYYPFFLYGIVYLSIVHAALSNICNVTDIEITL